VSWLSSAAKQAAQQLAAAATEGIHAEKGPLPPPWRSLHRDPRHGVQSGMPLHRDFLLTVTNVAPLVRLHDRGLRGGRSADWWNGR
jgi:hypothetical protein